MLLNKNNVSLKISAGLNHQLIHDSKPQFAFSGRSNVGKSSLVNKLLGRKALARVSSTPGKTITINYYEVDEKIYLVDLPGYGYAMRSGDNRKSWSRLTNSYFENNPELKCVLQLVDLKVGITAFDEMMLDWLYETQTYFIIVATKADKLNKTNRAKQLEALRNHPKVPDDVFIVPFSALSGEGADTLWEEIILLSGEEQ